MKGSDIRRMRSLYVKSLLIAGWNAALAGIQRVHAIASLAIHAVPIRSVPVFGGVMCAVVVVVMTTL